MRSFPCLAVLVLASTAAAQVAPPASCVPTWKAEVDALFAAWDKPGSPGCAVGVIQDGQLVHARGFGLANLEHEIKNTSHTVFDIASTSKQFTASCVGLLAQDGKLTLEDDLRTWIPELPDYGAKITLRHLLNHTSGLRDYLELWILAGRHTEDYTTKEQALALIARQKELNFAPGTEFLYSNSGYFVLSIVVERAAGKSLPEFARERIFEPLGMRATHIHDDHTLIVKERATGYSPRAGGGFGIEMSDFEQTGDGGVMTTVEDLARWDANFYTHAVGGEALQALLHEQGRLASGQELDYGAGLQLSTWRGQARVRHGGSWAGYRSELLRFPALKTSVIVLCNLGSMNPGRLAQRVAEIVLAEKLGPEEPPAKPDTKAPTTPPIDAAASAAAGDLALYAGVFASDELDARLELVVRAGKLLAGEVGLPQFELQPAARDRFTFRGGALEFERDAQGALSGMRLSTGRMRHLLFVRAR